MKEAGAQAEETPFANDWRQETAAGGFSCMGGVLGIGEEPE